MAGLGDEIASVITEMRDLSEDELMPDTYEIERTETVPDGYGGETEETTIVESGDCRLSKTSTGTIGVNGDVMVATAPYVVHVPLSTDVQASDTIIVNERAFDVTGNPRRSGAWAIDMAVDVEARR